MDSASDRMTYFFSWVCLWPLIQNHLVDFRLATPSEFMDQSALTENVLAPHFLKAWNPGS